LTEVKIWNKIEKNMTTKLSKNSPKKAILKAENTENSKKIEKINLVSKTNSEIEKSQTKPEKSAKVEIIFLSKSKVVNYFSVIHEMFAFIKTKKRLGEIVQKMNENQETYFVGLLLDGVEMGFCEFNITYQLWGELICYVNHLIVKKTARGLGFGTQILDFVMEFAEKENCEGIELRSDLFRKKAHTFYYKKGFGIDCFNFRKNLK